ncbi:hypothetical protein E2C01_050039 [Portunus trituberculatus]|uniref:Uncharacterized protein n=1 Tax=Portunus trituberculatus TaxID=210409 RepID=A0A5B7GFL2_PORTR|nr:hypothetical protein [Portunus trituberculatus]
MEKCTSLGFSCEAQRNPFTNLTIDHPDTTIGIGSIGELYREAGCVPDDLASLAPEATPPPAPWRVRAASTLSGSFLFLQRLCESARYLGWQCGDNGSEGGYSKSHTMPTRRFCPNLNGPLCVPRWSSLPTQVG